MSFITTGPGIESAGPGNTNFLTRSDLVFSVDHSNSYMDMTSFYRAMHSSAKRDLAITCCLSVRLSVRLSICDIGGS